MATTTTTTTTAAAATRVDILQRIYDAPWDIAPLLGHFLEHAQATYGAALTPRNVDILRLGIERNHPAWNIVIATVLIDTLDSLRERILAFAAMPGVPAHEREFTRLFLVFVREKCTQLRTSSFSERDMHEKFSAFAQVVSCAYVQRDRRLVEEVARIAESAHSFDTLGYAVPLSADTLAARARGALT